MFRLTYLYKEKARASLVSSAETVARMCSVKCMLLKILQNSRENTCARVFFNKVADVRRLPMSQQQRDQSIHKTDGIKFIKLTSNLFQLKKCISISISSIAYQFAQLIILIRSK